MQARNVAQSLERPSVLDSLLDRSKNARLVLIGEASHGTHEYYKIRAAFTKRLITDLGFSSVIIEADQPNCEIVDQSIRLVEGAPEDPENILRSQRQWPSWMLANNENVEFFRWLRGHNQNQSPENRVSFHGLDVYPLWGATREVLNYLSHELGWSPDRVNDALDAPLRGEPMVPTEHIANIAAYISEVIPVRSPVVNAETYYQNLLSGGAKTANARAELWLGTLDSLLERGKQSRVVLWAHNTHVGDARGTDSSAASIGQLVRERYGSENVVLVGQAGGSGTVMAAHERGAAMDTIEVPMPRPDSVEALLSEASEGNERALFVFPEQRDDHWLAAKREHRAIGVVYDSTKEVYVPTRLGQRYDAMVWCENTTPVQALHLGEARRGRLETLRVPTRR